MNNVFLKNYFEGQIKDIDEIPAFPPTFKRMENKEYQQIIEEFIMEQKKNFATWREHDKSLQNLRIINMEKYIPLGLNIDKNYKEIFIKNLQITNLHENTYIKLKIASKICIYNYVIFLGEDANKDLIPVLIYDTETYYSLNLDDWDKVQEFYKEGKYILIINPNYTIYDGKMWETEGLDGLLCLYPNETILFKDEADLNRFFDLLNLNNFDSFKSLGDIMIIRKYYDKAIYFYEKAIKIKDIEIKMIKIYSLLCECYIRYKYFTKGLEYIDKCINLIDLLIQEDNDDDIDISFIMTSLFRKIKCLVGLRNFKLAYEAYIKIKEDKKFQNHFGLDEKYIKKFLNEKNNSPIIETINIGYDNYCGKFNIRQILIDEKEKFFLDNGDYINPKLEISHDPVKGIKIIAKEDINVGEYILAEKAIYICRTHDPNNNFETNIKLQYPSHIIATIEYIDCINNLIKILKRSPLDYKEFFILYNKNNLKENYESRMKEIETNISNLNVEYIEQIFKLNAYKTLRFFYSINKIGLGLWKYFSLFNHSCLPNTTNYGIGDFVFLMANRLIKKGEEVTILYLTTPKCYEGKKDYLNQLYNFECNCNLCQTEKNNRKKNSDILNQFDKYIEIFTNPKEEMVIKENALIEFPVFLENIKDILTNYELGLAYLEISSCSPDFNVAYKYYNIANKYLNDDFELRKLNLNKIIEFCDSLIEQGDISILDKLIILKKSFINFYKLYYNLKENEIDLFVKINKEQKKKDLILQQVAKIKTNLYEKNLNNYFKK